MAHKTFISYKFSESVDLRDKIIKAMGDDAQYYQGECSESPDMSDYKTETIRNNLKDMIWGTSVTIVILSPNMLDSKWIPWEISYSLRMEPRAGRTSYRNGVVAVIKKVDGGYDWLKELEYNEYLNEYVASYKIKKLPKVINDNRFNSIPPIRPCKKCSKKTINSQCAIGCSIYNSLNGSYITIVEEEEFLLNLNKYIDNAFEKSKELDKYSIHVDVEEEPLKKYCSLF